MKEIEDEYGSLVVYAHEKHQGKSVKAYGNGKEWYANVVARTVGGQLTFAAIFPRLKTGRYSVSIPYATDTVTIDVFSGHEAEGDFRKE